MQIDSTPSFHLQFVRLQLLARDRRLKLLDLVLQRLGLFGPANVHNTRVYSIDAQAFTRRLTLLEGSAVSERVHFLLRLLDILLELLERLLSLLAVLDEAEVLLLELGEDVEQLLRLLEVHLEFLVVVAALFGRHARHAAACVVHLRALTRAARRPLPAIRQVGSLHLFATSEV